MFPTWEFAHIFLAAVFASGLIIRVILQNDFKLIFVGEIKDFMDLDRNAPTQMSKVSNIVLKVECLFYKLL